MLNALFRICVSYQCYDKKLNIISLVILNYVKKMSKDFKVDLSKIK